MNGRRVVHVVELESSRDRPRARKVHLLQDEHVGAVEIVLRQRLHRFIWILAELDIERDETKSIGVIIGVVVLFTIAESFGTPRTLGMEIVETVRGAARGGHGGQDDEQPHQMTSRPK